jgi:phosphatidylserine/phosphatidylglycerophosphate/cardiolipin synthase-like enzyme
MHLIQRRYRVSSQTPAQSTDSGPPSFQISTEPTEWSGGGGINEHNKFVVTDFNLPSAKVFTGSCNLSPSGESGNGDNLILIEDQRVATSYTIQAINIFDYQHVREKVKEAKALPAKAKAKALTLQKPTAISGNPTSWFASSYVANTQAEPDRLLFSHEAAALLRASRTQSTSPSR